MAKYLENYISFNDMRAFVCENSEDMNLFMDTMCEEQRLRVNAVKAPAGLNLENLKPKHPLEKYKYESIFLVYRIIIRIRSFFSCEKIAYQEVRSSSSDMSLIA